MYSFQLLDVEEKFKNTLEVKSAKLKNKYVKGSYKDDQGLFSQVVFGSNTPYTCGCGALKGILYSGMVCDKCGVKVQSADARRNTFGKIDLGKDVYLVNPTAFKLLINDCLTDKYLKTHAYSVLIGKEWVSKTTGEISKTYIDDCYTGPHAFKEKIYPLIIESIKNSHDPDDYLITHILPRIDKCLFTHLIPIIPPDLRPIISGAGNTNFIDEINKPYMIMRNYVTYINDSPILPYDKIAVLQSQYFKVAELLLKKLSSKSGIMRKYLLAKRVDYSARLVIIPDSTLNIDQIDVSFYVIKEVFKPTLLPKLAKKLNISELEAYNKYDSVEYEDALFQLCQSYKNYPTIINRQPTLHKLSILVFYIRNIIKDYALVLPPISTEPFNADFDGDQMALYFPIGGAAYNEALNMVPYKNLFLPSNGELAFEFKEDLILGLYKLSLTEEGKKKIYSLIPKEAYPYIQEYMDKKFTSKVLNKILSILVDKLPNQVFANMINDLAHLSHNEAKISISLSDYANAKEGDLNNSVSLMVEAGARGKWEQVKQISETRGFISDVEGKIIPTIIASSLLEGLTPNEYFTSAYGGLKGIIDSSRNTSVSGYLTRRLIYLINNLELSENEHDCGSNHYIKMNLNEDYIKMFLYRVVKLDPDDEKEYIITKDNFNEFINKDLYIRSPLTCLSKNGKICHKCYGYLFKKHNSRQIGYIAAQSIGERASQLTLRTKHTSGATNISLPDWIQIEEGFIKTKVPTIIITNNNDTTIINSKTEEEVDLPYSSIEIICENMKEEIINEDDDPDIDNLIKGGYEVDGRDDDELLINSDDSIIKYTIFDIGTIAKISMNAHDITAAVSDFGKYLKKLPKFVNDDMTISDVLLQLIDKLGLTNIHSVHYELLLSMFARRKSNPNDFHRNYPDEDILWFKENEVLDSMLINSLVFERFQQKLPKLLISDPETMNWKSSIFSLLTTFNFGTKAILNDLKVDNLFGNVHVPINWKERIE